MGHTFWPLRAVVHPLQVDQAPELTRPLVAELSSLKRDTSGRWSYSA